MEKGKTIDMGSGTKVESDNLLDYITFDEVARVGQRVESALGITKERRPVVGLICGSGLGGLADALTGTVTAIPYSQIPEFPETSVKGHAGQLVFGELEGKLVICMQGRFHPYEGHSLARCALPVRVMDYLGVKVLIITSAAGGLNQSFKAGDLMVIRDHISLPFLTIKGPLIGRNDERLGPRFLSLNNAYDREFRKLAHRVASESNHHLQEGTYFMVGGPQFETPAEVRMLSMLGGDVAGMSTAHECIAARHCGMKVFAMSLVTNVCQPNSDSDPPANLHEEVLAAGKAGAAKATTIVRGTVRSLGLGMMEVPAQL